MGFVFGESISVCFYGKEQYSYIEMSDFSLKLSMKQG